MSAANQNAVSNNNIKISSRQWNKKMKSRREKTYSLPVQKVEASDASQAITPLSSSGRPSRPSGFKLDHLSNKCGCVSTYAAVILRKQQNQFRQYPTGCGPRFPIASSNCFTPRSRVIDSDPIRSDQKPIHRLGQESNRGKWCTQLTRCICVLAREC